MPADIQIFETSDPDWNVWLASAPHDIYFLADYHRVYEQQGDGKAYMVAYGVPEKYIAWPYLVNEIKQGYFDAQSVYGYTGPVSNAYGDPDFAGLAIDAFKEVWREQKLVSMFTKFHPILNNQALGSTLHGAREPAGGEIIKLGRSVAIDLSLENASRFKTYPKNLRQEIASAARKGLCMELSEDWSRLQQFVALYHSTMKKNEAAERYFFSTEYFDALRKNLPGKVFLATAIFDDELAAALVFTINGSISQAHLTGINPDYLSLSPLKGLIDYVAGVARQLGAESLHLGAGRGGAEDKLFLFKSRFSNKFYDFHVGRYILDDTAYDSLIPRGAESQLDFFPQYRAA